MSELICLIIGLSIGTLFGITLMCCLQINRINNADRRREEDYEKEKH